MDTNDKHIQQFITTGKIEGYSYLLLLFVAMPLKYIWQMPEYVRIVGLIHGILFVVFVFFIVFLMMMKQLTLKQAFFAFILSLVPFGTFFLKRI